MELVHNIDTLCFMPLPATFTIEVTAEDEKAALLCDGPVCEYCPLAHATSRALDLPVGLVEAGDRGIELWPRMTGVFINYLPAFSEAHHKYVEWWDTGTTKFPRPTSTIFYTLKGGNYVQ